MITGRSGAWRGLGEISGGGRAGRPRAEGHGLRPDLRPD